MKIQFKTAQYLNIFKHPLMGVSVHNWFRILVRQGFRIHPAFWFRTLFITLTAFANAPFQLYEYLRFSGKIKRQKVEAPVFILGHPRSGTTHLHYLMSKDEQFGYCSVYDAILPETFLSGSKLFKKLIASSLPETRPQDEVKVSIDSPKEEEFAMAALSRTSYMHTFYFPRRVHENFMEGVIYKSKSDKRHWQRYFQYFLRKLTIKHKGKRLLLKSPANTARVSEILELFPDAKFVHISRNPYEVFQSTVRLYEKVVPLTAFQKPDDAALENSIVDAYTLMYRKYIDSVKDLRPDQLIEVRFKDLDNTPLKVLENIYTQLGLAHFEKAMPAMESEVHSTDDYIKNTYIQMDEELKTRLKGEWSFAFDYFGYKA